MTAEMTSDTPAEMPAETSPAPHPTEAHGAQAHPAEVLGTQAHPAEAHRTQAHPTEALGAAASGRQARTSAMQAAHTDALRTVHRLLNWRSLRWKIAALVAVAACAVALAVGLLVHHSTLERSMNENRAKALVQLENTIDDYRQTGDTTNLTTLSGLQDPLRRQVEASGQGAWYDDRTPTVPWTRAAGVADGRVFEVKVDATNDMLSRKALDRHMWMASLAALVVIVPLAALAAELPNRRLRRVAATARRITTGDLDARTGAGGRGGTESGAGRGSGGDGHGPRGDVPGGTVRGGAGWGGDEITEIALTVDSMADSLQDRLRTEQRFTADVAHELRTPLMGLVTAAELLPESEATDLVRDRVGVLRGLVEDLLEVSRLDAGAEQAQLRPVALGEAVAESLDRAGLSARLAVTGAPVAETDPRRLDRIVANLVANAHRHGATPVDVTVTDSTIEVRDHGPGFPPDLLAHGPRRFRTGAAERGRGHGLGLTIAAGQARVIGATLTFTNAPDGGALAVLRLPPARQTPPEYVPTSAAG